MLRFFFLSFFFEPKSPRGYIVFCARTLHIDVVTRGSGWSRYERKSPTFLPKLSSSIRVTKIRHNATSKNGNQIGP
jgi:hypothetical protein